MKKLIYFLLTCSMVFTLSACGSGSSSGSADATPTPKVYVSDDEIDAVLSNPDDYKGKYINITGKIFNVIDTDSDGSTQYQAYYDIENYDKDFAFTVSSDAGTFSTDAYVNVDGQIAGEVTGENMLGTDVSTIMISADTVTELSYMDAVVPTLKTITPGLSQEQNGVTVSIDKVEIAEKETRVYVTETNNGSDNFDLWVYEAAVIQNGTQINLSSSGSSYEGEYPELSSSLLPGASSSGILVFDPVDAAQGFQVNIPCASENWEVEMQPFVFDVPAAQ